MRKEIDYLNPQLPAGLRTVRAPLVEATDANLRGYGFLVDRPDASLIEIVRWPSTGKRSVDPDSGDEAGTKEGVFISSWQGDILFGRNEAVDGHYVLGYGCEPENASERRRRLA